MDQRQSKDFHSGLPPLPTELFTTLKSGCGTCLAGLLLLGYLVLLLW